MNSNNLNLRDRKFKGEGVFPAVAKEDIKVGVIHIGNPADGSGYTFAHDQGIVEMQKALGLSDSQIIRKNNVNDTDPTATDAAIRECIEEGAHIVFGTSWGYMDTLRALAEEYPDVIFSHGSGYKSNDRNFNNYFGRIYLKIFIRNCSRIKNRKQFVRICSSNG